MLKLAVLELFARGVPEGLLFVLAAYTFAGKRIDWKRYFLTATIYTVIVYLIRLLPIQLGINTIMALIGLIVLYVVINKLEIVQAIQVSIITVILEFLCEAVNVIIIKNILKVDIQYVFSRPDLKVLYGIPSLLIFMLVVAGYYVMLLRKGKLQRVN
ncbi:MAG: hypothetical protein Q8930_10070 [Bacillota bacterium]|nr:hypothetical protein [Bacillota bacterium]